MNNSSKRIVLLYFCISVIWIYTSDLFFESALTNLSAQQKYIFNILKGICFVSITTFLLYKLINKYYHTLKKSQEEYKAMFYANPNPMWVYDTETLAFINVNEAAINKYGFTKAEFLKMKVTDIRPSEDVAKFIEYIQNNDHLKGSAGIWRHILKNGSLINAETFSYDIVYRNRKAKLILAIDITDKIKYEQQLSEQQQSLKATNSQLEIIIKELKINKEKISRTQDIARIAGWVYIIEKGLFKFTPHFYQLLEIEENPNALTTFSEVEKFICVEVIFKFRSFMEKLKNGDKEGECILRIKNDDKWKFIKFGALLRSDDSNHNVLEGFVQDITRLELKDQLIKTTLERFEQLATTTTDTIYEWDYQNDSIRWAGNIDVLVGDTDSQTFYKKDWWLERVHPEDFLKNQNLLTQAIKNGEESLKREYRFRTENGQYKLLYDQATIKYDEQRNVIKIIGSLSDIEEITRVNKENKRLGEIVNKVKNLIIITNRDGLIEWVNAAFLEKTGYKWKNVRGKTPMDLFKVPSSSEETIKIMVESMRKKEFFNIEMENLMKDGSICWYQIDGSPIYDDKSNYEGYIAIESDITERKVREEKIKHQNRLLKESAWINSHQVRKPLASILGLIQLMQLADNEKETEEYLSLLEICSNELDVIIKRSIDLTDIQE